MEVEKLKQVLKPYFTPLNLLVGLLILGAVLGMIIVSMSRDSQTNFINKVIRKVFKNEAEQEKKIQIEDGDNKITINENGLVEFETPDNIFYQTWDSSKIQRWFSILEKEFQESEQAAGGQGGYQVQISSGGEDRTIDLGSDSSELEDLWEIFEDNGEEESSLSDYFQDPTPSPKTVSANGSSSGQGDNQDNPDCTLWGEEVADRAIISNTVCTKEE